MGGMLHRALQMLWGGGRAGVWIAAGGAGVGEELSMRQKLRGSPSFKYAKTDLYDPVGRTFYIQYPSWFIIVLALAGVAAFAVTGFLGYTGSQANPNIDPPFRQPWVLYLWLSALMVTL